MVGALVIKRWRFLSQHGECCAQVPLFPGDCELRQLLHIFKLLGTPTEEEWAGVSQLRDWHEFPNWRKQSLAEHFPTLEPAGVDLLDAMFIYDPADRITVGFQPPELFLCASLCVPSMMPANCLMTPVSVKTRLGRELSVLAPFEHSSAACTRTPLAKGCWSLIMFNLTALSSTGLVGCVSCSQSHHQITAQYMSSCACRQRMRCTIPTLTTWTRTRWIYWSQRASVPANPEQHFLCAALRKYYV